MFNIWRFYWKSTVYVVHGAQFYKNISHIPSGTSRKVLPEARRQDMLKYFVLACISGKEDRGLFGSKYKGKGFNSISISVESL